MGLSTGGLIGAVIGAAVAALGYVPHRAYYRAYFRQQLAQFDPADGERQRELLRWRLEKEQGSVSSWWVQLSLTMIFFAFVGYVVGQQFD